MSTYLNQRHLFKAYDIRGDRKYFTSQFIAALSHAFVITYASSFNILSYQKPSSLNAIKASHDRTLSDSTNPQTVVVGHDVRHLSLEIAQCMAQTLSQYGVHVVWLGLVTTPIMAFWAHEYDGHGIIATASHSKSHINGVKWLIDAQSPSSSDIQAIYNNLDSSLASSLPSCSLPLSSLPIASLTVNDYDHASEYHVLPRYQMVDNYNKRIQQAINDINNQFDDRIIKTKLTIVIDCLNGATAPFAESLFTQFSHIIHQVHVINDTPNPDFPKGNPDPTEAGRLADLQQAVIELKADIGLGFDGDGDRIAVVDNLGRVVVSDHLLYLLSQVAIEDNVFGIGDGDMDVSHTNQTVNHTPTIIFDVKCSHHLPILIEQLGAIPHMSKTGSSIMRRALQSGATNAIFAGELSGHFMFNDGYFILHDDAMYAGLRLLNWLSVQHKTLGDIIDAQPTMVNTPDIYLPLTHIDKSTVISTNQELLTDNSHIQTKLNHLCDRLQSICNLRLCSDTPIHCNGMSDISVANDSNNTSNNMNNLTISATTDTHLERCLPNDYFPKGTQLTCIDGIRLDFANGFGIVRPSNTSHSLTVRFAGNTLADLQEIQARFIHIFELIDHGLASQIAQITPYN